MADSDDSGSEYDDSNLAAERQLRIEAEKVVLMLRAKVTELKKENKALTTKCNRLETWKESHMSECKQNKKDMDEERKTLFSRTQIEDFLSEFGGLSRFTIVNDKWHEKHPTAANRLLGFDSWEDGKAIMRTQFPELEHNRPELLRKKATKADKGQDKLYLSRETSHFERCVAVKMMDRTGMTANRCASIYHTHDRTVTTWRREWCTRWGITETQVFQSQPMLGPSACKKRRLLPPAPPTEDNNESNNQQTGQPQQNNNDNNNQQTGQQENNPTPQQNNQVLLHQDNQTYQQNNMVAEQHNMAAAAAAAMDNIHVAQLPTINPNQFSTQQQPNIWEPI